MIGKIAVQAREAKRAKALCQRCGEKIESRRLQFSQTCSKCSSELSLIVAKRRTQAAAAVAKAIKDGRLKPARECKCSDCGKPATCYDHRDYRKPLSVVPVCKRCDAIRGPGKPYPNEVVAEHDRRPPTKALKANGK